MNVALKMLEIRRVETTSRMDRRHRSTFGQFFTPGRVADFMASLFSFKGFTYLLDPGAGIGSLTAAIATKATRPLKAVCYEIEPAFQEGLRTTLQHLPTIQATALNRDFIQHTVELVAAGQQPGYTHAILNPPYKKINAHSIHRLLIRKLGVETSNLYTCFLACTVMLCAPGAQVVAIVPRSFMNGPYFKPFRYWLLDRAAITHIHVFDSRDRAFSDDDVLQENVIVRLIVQGQQRDVVVSASHDQTFTDVRRHTVPFSEIVTPDDDEKFIHIPSWGSPKESNMSGQTLRELGLDVCTGPVVDFRLRSHLRAEPSAETAPLLYSTHFVDGLLQWPKRSRKPNAIMRNPETERWLMRKGCYVVLRRFSSKEEKRRVVAYLLDGSTLPGDVIGFENHLNVIHQNRNGLDIELARGLCAYLNSQAVDDYFRTFSGHTQVNATDLRRLKYPTVEELRLMGRVNAQEGPRSTTNFG